MSLRYENNKAADKPVHPHSLITAFVIHALESIISKLATSEISVSIAEQAGYDQKPRRQVLSHHSLFSFYR